MGGWLGAGSDAVLWLVGAGGPSLVLGAQTEAGGGRSGGGGDRGAAGGGGGVA